MTGRGFTFWFLAGAVAGLIGLALLIFASPGFPSTEPWSGAGAFTGLWAGGPFSPVVTESGGGDTPAPAPDLEALDFSEWEGETLSDLGFDTTTAWDVSGGLARAAIEYTGANLMTNGDFETGLAAPFDYAPAPSIVTNPVGGGTYAMFGVSCYLGCSGASWLPAEANKIYHLALWRYGLAVYWAGGYVWNFTASQQKWWCGIVYNGGLSVSGQFPVLTGEHLIFKTDAYGGQPIVTDNFVFQQVKDASTLATHDFEKNYSSAKAGLTLAYGQWAGVAVRVEEDGDGIYATLHREDVASSTYWYAELWTRADGVWARQRVSATTYEAGGEIEILDDGADGYTMQYEGGAAGSNTLPGFTGTRYGMFSASPDAIFNTFTLTE